MNSMTEGGQPRTAVAIQPRGQISSQTGVQQTSFVTQSALPKSLPAQSAQPTAPSGFPDLRQARPEKPSKEQTTPGSTLAGPLISTVSSLAIVLGLFAGLVWISRRYGSVSPTRGKLPETVLQTLGSTPIDAKTKIVMLRCGNKILIVAQTAGGMQPISEITDAGEVEQITQDCLGTNVSGHKHSQRVVRKNASTAYA